jgi:hypothetical protein
MGTWGAGAFDSDMGLGIYRDHTGQMIKTIERRADDPGLEVEDLDETLAVAAMLATLAEHVKPLRLEKARVIKWKKRFLEVFDAEIDDLGASEDFVEARRKLLEETFDRIARCSHDETAPPKGAGRTGSLNVTRAVGAGKMAAHAEVAAKAGAKRGRKKKV